MRGDHDNQCWSLSGGRYLVHDGLRDGTLALAGGRIAEGETGGRKLDVSGCVVLPGIVDAHGDGFERHLAPRRGAVTDLSAGLRALEADLAANGITTATLAQFWSWEGGMRGPDFARRLIEGLSAFAPALDLRLQLRVEVALHADFPEIGEHVRQHGIRHLVFNDHLPHKALREGRRVPRLEGQALKAGRSPQAHQALLEKLFAGLEAGDAALSGFCRELIAQGVALGSHDDPDAPTRRLWRGRGARIAEFPTTREAAEEARAGGDAIVLGAPNVLRGGSHKKGGIDATALVEAGLCDVLASDYHYPAPMGAMRRLLGRGWTLDRAWQLVSEGPARLLGLDDRGRIAPGLRADVIVAAPDLSEVFAVFCGGRPVVVTGALAARWLA